jgi:cytochrome c
MKQRMKGIVAAALLLALASMSYFNRAVQANAPSAGGDPSRGREMIAYYGCGSCHTIPGVIGAQGLVGPLLTGIGNRVYLAGVLLNNPGNMAVWIQNPRAVDQLTVMPNLHVTPGDASDIASYLTALR